VCICVCFLCVAGVTNVMLKQLEVKRQGEYVTPKVLQIIFNYFLEM